MRNSDSRLSTESKQVRLPFVPLPGSARAIGLSSRVKHEKGIKWEEVLKASVRETHGPNCFYCGAPPDLQWHDCHEVFEIDDAACIIRLVNIVPVCKDCHLWADGKPFVTGPLAEPIYWTAQEFEAYIRRAWHVDNASQLDDRCWPVGEYRRMQHFLRVNNMTLEEAREYLQAAARQQLERDKSPRLWQVDYGQWSWAAGLSEGELYVPNRHDLPHNAG